MKVTKTMKVVVECENVTMLLPRVLLVLGSLSACTWNRLGNNGAY